MRVQRRLVRLRTGWRAAMPTKRQLPALLGIAICSLPLRAAQGCTHSESCAPHGACIAGACACTDGYSGATCGAAPDPCAWPVVVRCGAGAECIDGACGRADACGDDTARCGEHGGCEDGHCVCENGWAGAECSDVDECASSPCRNGGSCFHSADVQAQDGPSHAQLAAAWTGRHVCACATGYAGAECQCMHCGEHGACQFDGRCVCDAGFVGAQCEINVDECASRPCVNGATCNDLDFAYSCSCVVGYEGEHCEHDMNECASSPCGPHGACVDGVGAYSCSCDDGWSGEHCSEAPPCLSEPCQNGASCVDYTSASGELVYRCKCKAGWLGGDCEYHACEASPPPCANGGTCDHREAEADARGFACECVDGYRGAACEEKPDPCRWPTPLDCGTHGRCQAEGGGRACLCSGGYSGAKCSVPPDPCLYPTRKDCGAHGAFAPFAIAPSSQLPLLILSSLLSPSLLVLDPAAAYAVGLGRRISSRFNGHSTGGLPDKLLRVCAFYRRRVRSSTVCLYTRIYLYI